MQRLYDELPRVAASDASVLITGESGTGKSLIAKAIHDFSDRRTLPFVSVTASELRDLEGPARVMARVRGGTLLIDGEPTRFPRRRGRPPAHRIETVAEEVPVPGHLVA